MLTVYGLLLPVISLIAVGGLAVRSGLFPAAGLPMLNRFVLTICIPVLIFSGITRLGSLGAMNWGFLLLYCLVALLPMVLAGLILRFVLGYQTPAAAMLAMAAGISNNIFLGYPIGLLVAPDQAATLFAWVVMGDTLVLIPLATAVAGFADRSASGSLAARVLLPLLRNPVVIGVLAGLAFLASGLPLPGFLDSTRASLVAAAPTLALFLIGGLVAAGKPAKIGPTVALIASFKLVVHPLLMVAALTLFPVLDGEFKRLAMLFAAMPMFTIFTIFAERHGRGSVAASTLLITTLLGGISVALAMLLLGYA